MVIRNILFGGLSLLSPIFSFTQSAQNIVDRSIAVHGGDLFLRSEITFTFRDRIYSAYRKEGQYRYTRSFVENGAKVKDILTNEGFTREIENARVRVPDSMADKYSNSINSVVYFARLPFGLNDPAVQKEYLGKIQVKGEPYHKIRVTFQQEGGGEDHDDVFIYWFHAQKKTLDYLAYRFYTEGGGIRFRQAYNARKVNGILFQDYMNYEMDPGLDINKSDQYYEADQLKLLSKIELEKIGVEILP